MVPDNMFFNDENYRIFAAHALQRANAGLQAQEAVQQPMPAAAVPCHRTPEKVAERLANAQVERPDWRKLPKTSIPKVFVTGDSMLICNWLNGNWSIRSQRYKNQVGALQNKIDAAIEDMLIDVDEGSDFCGYIPREGNREADQLSWAAREAEAQHIKLSSL